MQPEQMVNHERENPKPCSKYIENIENDYNKIQSSIDRLTNEISRFKKNDELPNPISEMLTLKNKTNAKAKEVPNENQFEIENDFNSENEIFESIPSNPKYAKIVSSADINGKIPLSIDINKKGDNSLEEQKNVQPIMPNPWHSILSRYSACFFSPPDKSYSQQNSPTQPGSAFSNSLAVSPHHYPSPRYYPAFQSSYFPAQYPWVIANHRPFLNSPSYNPYYGIAPGVKYIPSAPSFPYSFNPATAAAPQPVVCTLPYPPFVYSFPTGSGPGDPREKTNPISTKEIIEENAGENNFLHFGTPQELERGNIDIYIYSILLKIIGEYFHFIKSDYVLPHKLP